ncbi:class I SAM-dependent methyltransferase [Kribbella antibiotica]|nr:class I SAM-dependent methyltransferase [Kribbella antibiotica]
MATHTQHGHGDVLDLDAELLAEQLASITEWLPVRSTPRRIIDLGAGTGAGTFALLDRFPDAQVVAVDSSPEHLRRLREKAGTDSRVETVQADLDADWPGLGTADLVWASASLHHLADPDRALRQIRGLLATDGLLAVVELAGPPRFLPDDAPADRPGLEARLHAIADRRINAHLPHRGADWGAKLIAGDYTVEAERTLAINNDAPPAELTGRYAQLILSKLGHAVAEELSAEDRKALGHLLESLPHRTDLVVRTDRTVWAAR